MQQFATCLFTDEFRFVRSFHDGRIRVWRRRREKFHDATVIGRDSYSDGSIIMWSGMVMVYRTPLFRVKSNLKRCGLPELHLAVTRTASRGTRRSFSRTTGPVLPTTFCSRRLRANQSPAVELDQLYQFLQQMWQAIIAQVAMTASMSQRCLDSIRANGGHTRFRLFLSVL